MTDIIFLIIFQIITLIASYEDIALFSHRRFVQKNVKAKIRRKFLAVMHTFVISWGFELEFKIFDGSFIPVFENFKTFQRLSN